VLLPVAEQSVQTRLAAIGRVAMNDAALGRLIQCRDQAANLLNVGLSCSAHPLLERTQACPHATVLSGADERFSRTFRSGLCVSHFILIGRRRSRRPPKCQDADLARGYDEAREPDATLICEPSLSLRSPEFEAGESNP